jgi:hypothetical protein
MEKYVYHGTPFVCKTCNRKAHTKKEGVTECAKCRGLNKKDHSKCQNCNRTFFTTISKTLCRHCFAIKGNFSPSYRKTQMVKNNIPSIKQWTPEIKILLVKLKWNLFNSVDFFKIAHIYMDCVNNENKYSTLEIDQQIQYMLLELKKMMTGEFAPKGSFRRGREVQQIDDSGKVLKEYVSLRMAAAEHNISRVIVQKSCDHGGYLNKKHKRLRFRYKE